MEVIVTAQELAEELAGRGLEPLLVCEAGAMMLVASDPEALSKAMGMLGMPPPPVSRSGIVLGPPEDA